MQFEVRSHNFASVPGPVQTVQRAEYWEVVVALEAFSRIHVGVDNLNVPRGVAWLLDKGILGAMLSHRGFGFLSKSPRKKVMPGQFVVSDGSV